MSIAKKRFLAIFLCFTISIVSLSNFYFTQKVYADAFALPAITSGIFASESISAASATLVAAGPYALAIVGAGLACGLVYKNRAQISSFVCGAYNNLCTAGVEFGKDIVSGVGNVTYMTGKAKSAVLDYVNRYAKNNNSFEYAPLVRSLNVPANSTVWTNFHFRLNRDINLNFQDITDTYNRCNIKFKTQSGTVVDSFLRDGIPSCSVTYSEGYYYIGGSRALPNSYDGESVCIGFQNARSKDMSIDIDQILDFGLNGFNSAYPSSKTLSYPVGSSYGAVGNTAVTNSNDLTWDDVIGKTYDNVKSKDIVDTGVSDIPVDTPNEDIDLNLPTEVKLDFSPLYVNFKDRFPFSIPFDIYNVFKTFSTAERTPPKFDVEFDKGLVGRASFTIDLTQFDLVARLLRYFLLIMFLIGLMKITRSIMRA